MISKEDLRGILIELLDEFRGDRLIDRSITLKDGDLYIHGRRMENLDKYDGVYVIGFGKASLSMAHGVERILGDRITDGLVIAPIGLRGLDEPRRIRVRYGYHPYPREANLEASMEIIDMVRGLTDRDLLIILISGGGSSLFTLPYKGIELDDLVEAVRILMEAGGDIYELNVVRKHLSMVKGGRLAEIIYPARAISLIISDVVGDDLSTIASGPTAPDPSTYGDALRIIRKYGVMDSMPRSIINHLENGLRGLVDETPKPGSHVFRGIDNIIIGSNLMALQFLGERLEGLGLKTVILNSRMVGEARSIGSFISGIALEILHHGRPFRRPIGLIMGGETTVRVAGRGMGGRNQELVLSAGIGIRGERNIIIASIGTDGIDGNSPAAGAIIDGGDIEYAVSELGLDPLTYLDNNDSYTFLSRIGSTIVTGPTNTNVNDVTVVVIK